MPSSPRKALSTDSVFASSSRLGSPSKPVTYPHKMERSPLSPLDIIALAPRSPDKSKEQFEVQRWSFVYREDEPYFDFPKPPQETPEGRASMDKPVSDEDQTAIDPQKSLEPVPEPGSESEYTSASASVASRAETRKHPLSPEHPTKRNGLLSLSRKKSKPAHGHAHTPSSPLIDFSSSPKFRRGLFSSPSKSKHQDKAASGSLGGSLGDVQIDREKVGTGGMRDGTARVNRVRAAFTSFSHPPPTPSKDDSHNLGRAGTNGRLGTGHHPEKEGANAPHPLLPPRPSTSASHYPLASTTASASTASTGSTSLLSLPTPPLSAGSTAPSTPGLPYPTVLLPSEVVSQSTPTFGERSQPHQVVARPGPARGFLPAQTHSHPPAQPSAFARNAAMIGSATTQPAASAAATANLGTIYGHRSRPSASAQAIIDAVGSIPSGSPRSQDRPPTRPPRPGEAGGLGLIGHTPNIHSISTKNHSGEDMTVSGGWEAEGEPPDGAKPKAQAREQLQSQARLRDRLISSLESILSDHFSSASSHSTAQSERIASLERESQEAKTLLDHLQRDYSALDQKLSDERHMIGRLKKDLESEKKLRGEAISKSTALISKLEYKLNTATSQTSTLQGRIVELESQLSEGESRYIKSLAEVEKRNKELGSRVGRMERLEKEVQEWRARAEEGEFTVKALREEGVRMAKELGRKSDVIAELEKGRRFVTRV